MICPECNGVGDVRKRFLLFFTRRRRCPTCLGTGVFPPPVGMGVGDGESYRDNDDGRWPVVSGGLTTNVGADARDEGAFDVGHGGRSGGGGGGASWGASEEGDAPVIVDPFSSDASSITGSAVPDDVISSDSSSSTTDSSSTASSSDSGTSY